MTIARIDGHAILGSTPFVWTFRPGTAPSTSVADVTPESAQRLMSGGIRPLALELDDEADASGKGAKKIEGIYALQEVPGPNEHLRRVLLADRRWFWSRKHIRAVYNQRRHIGVKRLSQDGGNLVAMPVVDDVQYCPWSLRGDVPWSALDAVRDVLAKLMQHESEATGAGADFIVTGTSTLDAVPFENLVLDDSGDQALARLLAYLPDFDVTVDPNGFVRVYARADGAERDQLAKFGAEKVAGGHLQVVSLERIRPKEIHVLFTIEAELRVDFEEGADVDRIGGGEERAVENVLPLPDFTLAVDGTSLVRGSWVAIDDVLEAWGSIPVFGALTQTKLRRLMVPFMDLWAGPQITGAHDPMADWPARIATVQGHWRRTFRINRRWMDRIQRLNAYRLATIDQEHGTRAPAQGWSDYVLLPTQRSMLADVYNGESPVYAINVPGYPEGGLLAGSSESAPCEIRILDHDEGIIRIEWRVDPLRLHEMILPGNIENNPEAGFEGDGPIAFNALSKAFGLSRTPTLEGDYKAIMVLSAIPAVPNDSRQLFRVKVKPSDVADVLPPGLLSEGFEGPIMEVRYQAGQETARVAWLDSRSEDIERLFGLTEGEPNLEGLIINEQPGRRASAGSLNEIARAVAARIWAGFTDRLQGRARFGLVVGPVQGLVDELAVEVSTTGEVATTVETGRVPVRLNAFSLMPADVRNLVMRLAQQGK